MSGYKSFAVAGVGHIGTFFVDELLQLKKAGVINSVSALTRLVRTFGIVQLLPSINRRRLIFSGIKQHYPRWRASRTRRLRRPRRPQGRAAGR